MPESEVWWRRLVDAVIAYRQKRIPDVQDYLRWVQANRTRAVAEMARDNIKRYARAWDDVEAWPGNDYRPLKKPNRAKS